VSTREGSEPATPASRRQPLVASRPPQMEDAAPDRADGADVADVADPMGAVPGPTVPGDPNRLYRPSRTWELLSRFSVVNFIVAVVAAGIFAGLAGTAVLREKPTYESGAVIELHQAKVFTDAGPGPVTKLNALRARYAALADTQPVLQPIGQKLGLPPGQVGRATEIVVGAPSLLMRATARSGNRDLSQKMADAMADELSAYATKEQTDDKIAPTDQVQLRVVQHALPGVKVSPDSSRAFATAAVAGLVVLALAYTVLQLVTGGKRRRR
jgi:capsular polysaccharide biosynthesis protein